MPLRFFVSVAAAFVLLAGACAPKEREAASHSPSASTNQATPHDVAVGDSVAQPIPWPPRGGRPIALDDGTQAELIVDETGMVFVYLFDSGYRPLETEGRHVVVTVITPDGAARDVRLAGMGHGAAAHHMNPMDEAVMAHVRAKGAYTAHLTVVSEAGTARGETRVDGLATGGRGM